MAEKSKQKLRPRVIYVIAIVQALSAIIPLLIAIAGLVFLFSPPMQPQYDNLLSKCFAVTILLAGLAGTSVVLWKAWAFYSLKPIGYFSIKVQKWTPQIWLATGFGKRLDDKDVYEAFGLSREEAEDSRKSLSMMRRK